MQEMYSLVFHKPSKRPGMDWI